MIVADVIAELYSHDYAVSKLLNAKRLFFLMPRQENFMIAERHGALDR